MTADHDSTSDDLDRELEELLTEAEETVARLRRALHDRRTFGAQHAEIDRLEEHMANAKVRWSEVREFLNSVWRELSGRSGDEYDNGRPANGDNNRV